MLRTFQMPLVHIQILKQKLLSLKCMIKTLKKVAIEIAKLKLLKVLSSINDALCDSSRLLFSTSNPGDMKPSNILG